MERWSVRAAVPIVCVSLALPTACGTVDPAPSGGWQFATEVLPGGMVRAVNTPPAGGGAPTFALTEDLRIGSIDDAGPTSFGEVKGLAVTDDGRIAILDSQAQEIRIFGADGGHLVTYGGKGEGPGELQEGYGLMLGPDGLLWVPDHRLNRMSAFDPDRGFVDSWPISILSHSFVWRGAMGDDGLIRKPSITMSRRDRRDMLRVYDRQLTLLDTLPLPSIEVDEVDPPGSFVWGDERGGGMMQVPYFPQRRQAIDRSGAFFSGGYGDPAYRIVRWEPGGDTTLVIETTRDPVPVRAAERDSVVGRIREALERYGGDQGQDWSKIPDTKPSFVALFVTEPGHLWVRLSTVGPEAMYDVYGPEGRRIGSVTTDLPIWERVPPVVQNDALHAVVRDDFGVAYVVRAPMPPLEASENPARD